MVEILDETNRFPHAEAVAGILGALLAELGAADRSVTLVLLDDETMRERNRRDRGVDLPTDVLSYPTVEPDDVGMPDVEHLGDLFVSLETAARQGLARGHGVRDEVLVLAAHGVVHLLGHDHADEEAWRPFHEAQARVLELAGAS